MNKKTKSKTIKNPNEPNKKRKKQKTGTAYHRWKKGKD